MNINLPHADFLSEASEPPRSVILPSMPLVPFQRPHALPPQVSPYSRNSYSEDHDPTFDPNFDGDTVYDGLSGLVCLSLLLTEFPVQNPHTQRSDPPWRILTTRKCLVSPPNFFIPPEYPSKDKVNTLRAWVIGLFWAIVLPGVNQFFFFRYPTVTVGGVCLMNYHVRTY